MGAAPQTLKAPNSNSSLSFVRAASLSKSSCMLRFHSKHKTQGAPCLNIALAVPKKQKTYPRHQVPLSSSCPALNHPKCLSRSRDAGFSCGVLFSLSSSSQKGSPPRSLQTLAPMHQKHHRSQLTGHPTTLAKRHPVVQNVGWDHLLCSPVKDNTCVSCKGLI